MWGKLVDLFISLFNNSRCKRLLGETLTILALLASSVMLATLFRIVWPAVRF